MPTSLTHIDEHGNARMVNISDKETTDRSASATARLLLPPKAFAALEVGGLQKGDALGVARVAGIMAAKRTHELIPLCHPLPINGVTVDFRMDRKEHRVYIETTVTVSGRTGVEMEALTAASVAALTVYDMCKGVDKGIVIEEIALLRKEGGKSGAWHREG